MNLVERVLKEPTLRPNERIIVAYLATMGDSTQSQASLAKELSLGLSTTVRAIRRLTAMNVLSRYDGARTRPGYRVTDENTWTLRSRSKHRSA